MSHVYTFTAGTLNTNIFIAKTAANASDSDRVWTPANVTQDTNPPHWYIADNVEAYLDSDGQWKERNRRFWICGAYFGVGNSDESAAIAHLASLPAGKITKIEISFDVNTTAMDSYGYSRHFQCDTATNATGSNYAHNHSSPKEFLGTNVHIGKHVTLDMTSYGFPSSGGWLIHYSAWTDLRITSAVTLTVETNESYSLSLSAGTGSSITVNRTQSREGATGSLSDGATLYFGDKLKITFTPSTNYSITIHTVNGNTFTSGNTYTVQSESVTVVATATPVRSDISATSVNIGSNSTITITRYNTSYKHNVTYVFGVLVSSLPSTGVAGQVYVVDSGSSLSYKQYSNGSWVDADVSGRSGTIRSNSTDVVFTWEVPTSAYALIPNATKIQCVITCETFSGSTSLGTKSCQIEVTAAAANVAPTLSCSVKDTNAATIAVTGSDAILVRYKSTALCTILATANGSSSIVSKKINGIAVSGTTLTLTEVSSTSFVFEATDSRGYTTSQTINPTIISYVRLTCVPFITRDTPTNGKLRLSFAGDVFRNSFGESSNTLTVQYRYKLSTAVGYSNWVTISQSDGNGGSNYTFGVSSYQTNSPHILVKDTDGNDDTFNYLYSYDFEIKVYDALSTVTISLIANKGIPVFDWGENDFRVNTTFILGNTSLTEQQLQQLLALLT